jgi:chromosomal replication initiation ATPase DnaA
MTSSAPPQPARQIAFDLGHRPAHGRQDFLVAPSNRDAVAWIDLWPEWPAPALVLHGPASCGKTHLAAVWAEKTDTAFVTSAQIADGNADAIARTARNLVLDHVDPWFSDRAAETTLFHLYNIMKEEGRSLLLTMRMAPVHVPFALPDLASRLRAAPAAAIHAPDDTLLQSILVKLFSDRQLAVGQDVISYIVPRMERSFAAAADIVDRADKVALAEKKNIGIALIRQVMLQTAEQEDR